MGIAALTCRSFYSLLRASVSVLRWVQKAAEYGYGAVALADVNSMSGVVDLCQAAKKANVRPVVGVEILTDSQKAILLAEDDKGYGNLCRITTARNLTPGFDLIEQLRIDSRGVVCICSGPKLAEELREIGARGYLFIGCSDPKEAASAVSRGLEPIAWTGVNWLEDNDIEVAKLLARIRQLSVAGSGPEDNNGFGPLAPVSDIEQRFRNDPRALTNADQIVERCRFRLLSGKSILPKIKLDNGTTGDRELARLCHLGLAKRYSPASHEVIKRLEYELAKRGRVRPCRAVPVHPFCHPERSEGSGHGCAGGLSAAGVSPAMPRCFVSLCMTHADGSATERRLTRVEMPRGMWLSEFSLDYTITGALLGAVLTLVPACLWHLVRHVYASADMAPALGVSIFLLFDYEGDHHGKTGIPQSGGYRGWRLCAGVEDPPCRPNRGVGRG